MAKETLTEQQNIQIINSPTIDSPINDQSETLSDLSNFPSNFPLIYNEEGRGGDDDDEEEEAEIDDIHGPNRMKNRNEPKHYNHIQI